MRNLLPVVGALALYACSSKGAGDGAAGSGSAAKAKNVDLLDPGAEPRTLLAYDVAPHSKQSFAVTTGATSDVGQGKQVAPSFEMDGDVVFADRGADGGLPFTFTSTKLQYIDTPGAIMSAAALSGSLQGVVLGVKGTLGPTGHLSDFKLDLQHAPEGMAKGLDDFQSSYTQMVPELPDVPVGVGARWRQVIPIADNGVKASQTMDVTLVAVQGSTVTLRTAIAIAGAPQKIEESGADLKKFAGKGTFDATVDLHRMIGTTSMAAHADQEVVAMGQTIEISIDSTMKTAPR